MPLQNVVAKPLTLRSGSKKGEKGVGIPYTSASFIIDARGAKWEMALLFNPLSVNILQLIIWALAARHVVLGTKTAYF